MQGNFYREPEATIKHFICVPGPNRHIVHLPTPEVLTPTLSQDLAHPALARTLGPSAAPILAPTRGRPRTAGGAEARAVITAPGQDHMDIIDQGLGHPPTEGIILGPDRQRTEASPQISGPFLREKGNGSILVATEKSQFMT